MTSYCDSTASEGELLLLALLSTLLTPGHSPRVGRYAPGKLCFRLAAGAAVLAATLPGTLQAQAPARANLLVAEREARAEELAPPQRTRIEEGLAFIERASQRFNNVRGNESGLHYSSGSFPRRDKCIRYWIKQTNPLDRFAVSADGRQVTFDNAALRVGAAQDAASYRTQWFALDNLKNEERAVGVETTSGEARLTVPADAWGPADDAGLRYAVARIRTVHADNPQWQEPVALTLRERAGSYDVVGIERPRHDAQIKLTKNVRRAKLQAQPGSGKDGDD